MLRRIATSGLKGRKRQTRILLVALSLAFFFVTVSLLLLDTANHNRTIQRLSTFGDWRAVYINQPEEELAPLLQEQPGAITAQILGRDDRAGLMAAVDQDFWDMSHAKLIEGRFPESIHEIALEQGQLSHFAETPQIGDTIQLAIQTRYIDEDEASHEPDRIAIGLVIADRFREAFAEQWENRIALVDAWEEAAKKKFKADFESGRFDYDHDLYPERIEEYADLWREILEEDAETKEERLERIQLLDDEIRELEIQRLLSNRNHREYIRNLYRVLTKEDIEKKIRELNDFMIGFSDSVTRMTYIRSASDLEGEDGTTLQTRRRTAGLEHTLIDGRITWSSQILPVPFWPNLKDFDHVLFFREAVIIREMTLTGVIADYHNRWDGPTNQYPTGFVTPETGETLLGLLKKSKVPENVAHSIPYLVFMQQDPAVADDPPANLFYNQLARDDASGIDESLLTRGLLIAFSLITGFSIFQISLVQLKKRQRTFALMRSIGATTSQIKRLMSWEALYLLLIALPIGVLGGLITSFALIAVNNYLTGESIQLMIHLTWLLIAILMTLIGSLIGLFLPLRRLDRIAMIGNIQVIDQKVTKKTREIVGDRDITRQSLSSINRRHHRFIRKQRLISTLLYSLVLLILLGSLWLIYLSFSEYRTQVLDTDMPDFEFVRGAQQSNIKNRQMLEELQAVTGIERSEIMVRGERAFLWYDQLEENELHNFFMDILPGPTRLDYFSTRIDHVLPEDQMHLTKQAMVVDVYGLDTLKPHSQRLQSVLPADFDWEAFHRGKTVILLSPGYLLLDEAVPVASEQAERAVRADRMKRMFEQTKLARISYDYRRSPIMDHEPTFEGLDEVTLTIPTGRTITVGWNDEIPTNEVLIYSLDVGAVLHQLPRGGLWPLSYTVQNPVILMAKSKVEELYPFTFHGRDMLYNPVSASHRSERFGNTLANIYRPGSDEEVELAIKRIGVDYDFQVTSLYLIKQRLYAKGFQTSLIIGLLAVALLVITLQIQLTSAQGLVETERNRIGILQSIGVRASEYRTAYLLSAIKQVLWAILWTHLLLMVLIAAYLLIANPGSDLLLELQISLTDYPWLIHGLIVVIFFILGTLSAYLPLGNILARQPVANIRSLN